MNNGANGKSRQYIRTDGQCKQRERNFKKLEKNVRS